MQLPFIFLPNYCDRYFANIHASFMYGQKTIYMLQIDNFLGDVFFFHVLHFTYSTCTQFSSKVFRRLYSEKFLVASKLKLSLTVSLYLSSILISLVMNLDGIKSIN